MLNETMVTVAGNVASTISLRETVEGVPLVCFRLVATTRRFDRDRESWTDVYHSFYTVWAWRTLARNVHASVQLGEPLVVQGKLRVREGVRDGRRWADTSIGAHAVGHDLCHGTSAFARVVQLKAPAGSGSTRDPNELPRAG